MDIVLSFLLGLICGGVLTYIVLTVVRRRGAQAAAHSSVEAMLHEQVAALSAQAAAAEARASELRTQVTHLLDQQEQTTERERHARADESRILQKLEPVRETLRMMNDKVSTLERERAGQYSALEQQLQHAQLSDQQLRAVTESLASALRNNSTRGVWGEAQLRNVVEAAGLTHRVDFDLQSSLTSDAGAGRPDMTVHLPGGKSIAVDAKVPFSSYIEASQIPFTATGEEAARRTALIAQHVKALRKHINALSDRTYWAGLEVSPEFVIAFVPSESLLSSALEADPTLLDYSFNKKIALASPVNLWAVLKTVAHTWQQDTLTDDAKKLFELGKELYQRIGTLSEHSDKLRRAIESTVSSYNQFAASLESRVLVTARKLEALDDKSITRQQAVETSPKPLTAAEFAE
ncbi:DNA recombination protein RmuC [Lysinibacter sp. HNR]|uniref:DNA recombination protein RmuC n=1 Tax=Lysinibacter sp. HNR TaxID=3031408 RepID=UPI0024353C16|nr:DNA recombination protein RmuC [Lysinibacter sp. HNR]WGD38325.1 DNA recombination protein RmuC [Lysinibacter sp. HNR]